MPTKDQVEIAAKTLCNEWGWEWGHEYEDDECRCDEGACIGLAPDGKVLEYERPDRNTFRTAAYHVLEAVGI